jgi:hypothetical protein
MRRAVVVLAAAGVAVGAGFALFGSSGTLAPETVTARPFAGPSAAGPVLARAKRESPDAYRAARAAGAHIATTPDGRSFYVQSPLTAGGGGKTIVTFHGYLSTAFDDFVHWQAEAKRRGIRVIAIQWRLGKHSADSFTTAQMYAQARSLLRRAGVVPGDALVSGYSAAASRLYGLEYLDLHGGRLFSLAVANAGGALPGYSGYPQVFGAPAGRRTLRGSRWILFCGGRDPDPNLTGCPIMRRTRAKIVSRGGEIARFIVDPRANHGGFYENQANTRSALDLWLRSVGP